MRGYLPEGRAQAERVLALSAAQVYAHARLRALEAAGGLAWWQGDVPATRGWYADALELSRQLGDPALIANAAYNLSLAVALAGDQATARTLLDEALRLYRALGDRAGTAKTLCGLGVNYYYAQAYQAARESAQQALALFRELSDSFGIGWALHMLGWANVRLGATAGAPPGDGPELPGLSEREV